MAAIPLSNVLGSLVSGVLLNLDGWLGFAGWQWLFILEAVPAVVLSVAFGLYMTTGRRRRICWRRHSAIG